MSEMHRHVTAPHGASLDGDLATWAFVESSPLFRSLDDGGRRELIGLARLIRYELGMAIVHEGESSDDFFLVKRGSVSIETMVNGEAMEIAHLAKGSVFGEVALLTGVARTATVRASEDDTEVVCFSRRHVEQVLGKNPRAREMLERVLVARARDRALKQSVG